VKIEIKRAYEVASTADGYRVLIDRLWPRGVRKEELSLDEWCKDVAPSTELRKWFNHEADKADEFHRRYREELAANHESGNLLERAQASGKSVLTLIYSAKTPELSQAPVLKDYLEKL
jgi:uncharacterized protein YeaO (DUF488 family)